MIGFDGSEARGSGIRDHLAPIFSDHPTAAYIAKVREVRAIGSDGMLLRAAVGMVSPGAEEINPDVNAHQSLLAGRVGDRWRIVLFQTTPAQYHGRPQAVAQHTAEIERVRAQGATVG